MLHLAGKAHSNPADAPGLEAEFRRVNVTATESVACAAAAAGVSRFVFVSSIGVNGAFTPEGKPFSSADAPAPSDFYALTKLEAEQRLARICDASSMQLVIVRPTLVAGAGAPGNLARLADLIRKGIPIPLAVPEGRRHLVGVKALGNLLALSCVHEAAAGRVLLAAEDPALSAAEMAIEIARGLQVKPRLWRVPSVVLKAAGKLTGRSRDVARLCESLLVDTTTTQRVLGWESPRTIQSELHELGAALRARPRS